MSRPFQRGARSCLSHLLAACAYAALAVAYNWPLLSRLDSHITGSPGSDAGAYVWNQWIFRSEVVSGSRWPFRTTKILALDEPADLSLHNYTLFADLLSMPLQDHLGLVASFNVVFLALRVAGAYAMFLLAWALTCSRASAFLAGLLFGFSPFLSARGTAHFSLVAAFPLPLFVLFLWRAGKTGRVSWALAAGLACGVSAYCDPYYLVFCVLMLCVALAGAAASLDLERRPVRPVLARFFEAVALLSALAGVGIALSGGWRVPLAGRMLAMKTVYTPALILTVALAGRLLCSFRPRLALRAGFRAGPASRRLASGVAVAVVVLSPLLLALARRVLDGRFVTPPLPWRSSPAGVDLLAFLMPNPNHALWGEPLRVWLSRQRPDGFVENAASLTLVAMGVLLLAAWRRVSLPRAWIAFTLLFGALSLGPFVRVGGFNTGLPTPWTLLRYAPGVGLAHSPTRFAIVAMLGFAILFAFALRGLLARAPAMRPALAGLVGAALVFELAPYPRRLYAADVPALYATIAADPCDVRVLELPFGLRDGTRSVGDFGARAQFHQTLHGKPLVGGYLSRISDRRIESYRRYAVLSALIALSEGRRLDAVAADRARRAAPAFLRRARVGFVVIDRSRASKKLRRFAISALGLVRLEQQWPYELLVPVVPPRDAAGEAWPHAAPGCRQRPAERDLSRARLARAATSP